jgi:hypothetical protein
MKRFALLIVVLVVAACGRTRTPPPPLDAGGDAADATADAVADAATDTAVDAAPGDCEPLGPAACLAAGCVPTYDDSCCSTCEPGPCADCFSPDFYVCRSFEDACMAAFCSVTAAGGCEGTLPDCTTAFPMDEDTCDEAGCVPAVAPLGAPELPPTCVPINAGSCTSGCFIEPAPCPDGTVPEADGSCFTGLCIPAFVCG